MMISGPRWQGVFCGGKEVVAKGARTTIKLKAILTIARPSAISNLMLTTKAKVLKTLVDSVSIKASGSRGSTSQVALVTMLLITTRVTLGCFCSFSV